MWVPRPGARFWPATACLVLAAGTAHAQPPAPALVRPVPVPAVASAAAQDWRTRVYLVNGTDPFGWAGLAGLAERIQVNGYPYTRYGEMYDVYAFEREIRQLHAGDPEARFVLVGFSAGTLLVRAAANRLLRDGIPVAMLGYIGGDYLKDTESTRPAGVGRIVNVTGSGFLLTGRNLFWNGTELTGASNARLRGVSHFWLPGDPRTFRMLYGGLLEVSAGP